MSDIVAVYVAIDQANYYMGHIFDDKGPIGKQEIERTYREFFHSSTIRRIGSYIGPFESIEKVQKYSFYLCQSLGAEGIGLLSIDTYNNLLTKSHTTAQLKELLPKNYEYIKNIDHNKRGFFDRIFK